MSLTAFSALVPQSIKSALFGDKRGDGDKHIQSIQSSTPTSLNPASIETMSSPNSGSDALNTAEGYFSIDNMTVSFGELNVVRNLAMQLKRGEIGCLLGFSGCGKTTALRAIAGLELPKQGQIQLNGKTITYAENNSLTTNTIPAKRGMGMVFQDYALFTHLTVSENIGFGLHKWSKQERLARIDEMLELVDLTQHANKRISELSGGQQQRIALARALAPKPELLLLDEPFSNLDMMLRESLAAKVRDILKCTNTTAILVTHDQHEAFAIADKIGVMHQGKITQWATPDGLYHRPANPFVAEFVGEGAMIGGTIENGTIKTAIGDIPRHGMAIHDESAPVTEDVPVIINHESMNNELVSHESVNHESVSHKATSHQAYDTIDTAATEEPTEISPVKSSINNTSGSTFDLDKESDTASSNEVDGKATYNSVNEIKVLVRPDDIIHDDDSPLKATVIGRVFRGANYLYHLQLGNGEEVLSLISSHHDHAVGTKIGIRPMLAHVVIFALSSRPAEDWQRVWL